ncbi:MAG TPA: CocE/NonD family hydrolase, partial [Solirubrobacteraceae bacterium]|nr:CocE/NonD family hydrolase [Solirubrobacteraceae bacterium]
MASALRRRARIGATTTLAVIAALLLTASVASAFNAQGSVEQVYVTGLEPSAQMSLLQSNGTTVSTQTADSLGGLLFRHVAAGQEYRVKLSSTGEESGPLTVHTQAARAWDTSIYKQSIPTSGYGYLTTRDGTQLAVDVHLPGAPPGLSAFAPASKKVAYPTLIEYAGYGYANPAGPESGLATLANLMGFAVVDVNMRGTGCSGGAFDYFEPLENLDAYDVIETVAAQPWVLHHKVGMFGISYGGISQLFAAQLRPPALEAIAPLSVVDATATTLYPGGVLNTGFAVRWAEERQFDALPAGPAEGEHWAYEQIQNGDQACAANQDLHGEATNLLTEIKE